MAAAGEGRFVFAATRMHPDYDAGAPLRASEAPSAFALVDPPAVDPKVALLLPYGKAMAQHGAIVNVTRSEDGILRDMPMYETAGDWALPSLPLALAMKESGRAATTFPSVVRPNWRQDTRLPRISAANLLVEGAPVCGSATASPCLAERASCSSATPPPGSMTRSRRRWTRSCPASKCWARSRKRWSPAVQSACRLPGSST